MESTIQIYVSPMNTILIRSFQELIQQKQHNTVKALGVTALD